MDDNQSIVLVEVHMDQCDELEQLLFFLIGPNILNCVTFAGPAFLYVCITD
jgi:hypothetical protein